MTTTMPKTTSTTGEGVIYDLGDDGGGGYGGRQMSFSNLIASFTAHLGGDYD